MLTIVLPALNYLVSIWLPLTWLVWLPGWYGYLVGMVTWLLWLPGCYGYLVAMVVVYLVAIVTRLLIAMVVGYLVVKLNSDNLLL